MDEILEIFAYNLILRASYYLSERVICKFYRIVLYNTYSVVCIFDNVTVFFFALAQGLFGFSECYQLFLGGDIIKHSLKSVDFAVDVSCDGGKDSNVYLPAFGGFEGQFLCISISILQFL